jgi:hypothetical protein
MPGSTCRARLPTMGLKRSCLYSDAETDRGTALYVCSRAQCVMSQHKFKIGQRLFPTRSVGLDVSDGAYIVVNRLPKHDGEFEYQIKCVNEPDERVVRKSQLRPNPWRRHPGRPIAHSA